MSSRMTCGLVMLFDWTTRKRFVLSVVRVDGRVGLELRRVGLDVPDPVRVEPPADWLVTRLGTAAV